MSEFACKNVKYKLLWLWSNILTEDKFSDTPVGCTASKLIEFYDVHFGVVHVTPYLFEQVACLICGSCSCYSTLDDLSCSRNVDVTYLQHRVKIRQTC